MKPRFQDLTGQVFRGLKAIRPLGQAANGGYLWEVKCELCHRVGERQAGNLKSGRAVCPCSSRAGGYRESRPIQPTIADEMLSKPWRVS